jgi:hypothetical protein
MASVARPVTADDIRAKFSEIDGTFQSAKRSAAPVGIAVGAGALLAVVTVAYLFGRRRGRKRQTVVEIRRI